MNKMFISFAISFSDRHGRRSWGNMSHPAFRGTDYILYPQISNPIFEKNEGIKRWQLHAAINLRCFGYLVFVSVPPTDGSVNVLFDSFVFVVLVLYWVVIRNDASSELSLVQLSAPFVFGSNSRFEPGVCLFHISSMLLNYDDFSYLAFWSDHILPINSANEVAGLLLSAIVALTSRSMSWTTSVSQYLSISIIGRSMNNTLSLRLDSSDTHQFEDDLWHCGRNICIRKFFWHLTAA